MNVLNLQVVQLLQTAVLRVPRKENLKTTEISLRNYIYPEIS